MTDNGAKALAERLHETGECENWSPGYRDLGPDGDVILDEVGDSAAHRRSADAILAGGAVFLTAEEAERLELRGWQRDLLTFDADGFSFDQVVAHLLGVKSVNLRTEQDNEGNPTSEDRRWRVQYFGGTYGGTLRQSLDSGRTEETGRLRRIETAARALERLEWAETKELQGLRAALAEPSHD